MTMSTAMPPTMPPTEQPTEQPTPILANHEIKIILGKDYVSEMPEMEVGKTVRYSFNPPESGEVIVKFPERSPFRGDNVTGTEVPGEVILTLVSDSGESTLPCEYYIKPPSGPRQSIPWGGGGTKVTRPLGHP
jgi:hypothetical protein